MIYAPIMYWSNHQIVRCLRSSLFPAGNHACVYSDKILSQIAFVFPGPTKGGKKDTLLRRDYL